MRESRWVEIMAKLKQTFSNDTMKAQFVNLELSTSRFKIDPGQELVLVYESSSVQDSLGSSLRISFIDNCGYIEMVVWTSESEMYHADGRLAEQSDSEA